MCNALALEFVNQFICFRRIVKREFTKAMSFGARLAEERKRLGLRQAEFADLVGTDVPKQSLYENGRRELRADYLARLAEAGVDVLYVLTGERSEGRSLGGDASRVLSAYLALPQPVQDAFLALIETVRDQPAIGGNRTLHSKRLDYRAEDAG
jgi:transcriptional regulator with XRE-family HTH domain